MSRPITRSMNKGLSTLTKVTVVTKSSKVTKSKTPAKSKEPKIKTKALEAKIIKVIRKKAIKPKLDLEINDELKELITTLPKSPSKSFVFDFLVSKDLNLKKIIKSSNLDCFLFEKIPQKGIDHFTFYHLARAVVFQQLAGGAARTILGRVLAIYDMELEQSNFPSPQQILSTEDQVLRGAGLSTGKTSYLKDLALHYVEGKITDHKLMTLSDSEVYELLIQVKGVGPWTIDMFLMSCLKRLDVLPIGDLGVKKGIMEHFLIKIEKGKLISEQDMLKFTEHWRPYRSVGAWLMWEVANTMTPTK